MENKYQGIVLSGMSLCNVIKESHDINYTCQLYTGVKTCAKVTCVHWWMGHYAARTAKRHYAYANSPTVLKIDRGKLQMSTIPRDNKPVTCEKYRDRNGKLRFKGTKKLKQTEILVQEIEKQALLSIPNQNHHQLYIYSFEIVFNSWTCICLGSRHLSDNGHRSGNILFHLQGQWWI
jgi:hypothetical protein